MSMQGESNCSVVSPPPVSSLKRSAWSWSAATDRHEHEFQALIFDYEAKRVLLTREGDNWILPGSLIHADDYQSNIEPAFVIPTVQRIIGAAAPLAFLRHSWVEERVGRIYGGQYTFEKSVLLMEVIGDIPAVRNSYRWVSMKEANVFHLFDDARRAIKEEIYWAFKGGQPKNRLAWQCPGWFGKTKAWMESMLREHCDAHLMSPDGIVAQRSSALGVILRAETTKGRFFLKCTSPQANDAAYTKALAFIVPDYVAKPVFSNGDEQVMVTADYGQILTSRDISKAEKKGLSRDYARLQKGTIGKTDQLIRAGFPDLRPSKLLEQIDKLPNDPMFQELGKFEGSEAYLAFYHANRQMFKEELKRLIDSKVPATVTHNDLGITNFYKPTKGNNFMFFDWVEGFVGHPFTTCVYGIDTECFMQEWAAYGSTDELKQWASIGNAFLELARMIVRLRESSVSEYPYSNEALSEAYSFLQRLKLSFPLD